MSFCPTTSLGGVRPEPSRISTLWTLPCLSLEAVSMRRTPRWRTWSRTSPTSSGWTWWTCGWGCTHEHDVENALYEDEVVEKEMKARARQPNYASFCSLDSWLKFLTSFCLPTNIWWTKVHLLAFVWAFGPCYCTTGGGGEFVLKILPTNFLAKSGSSKHFFFLFIFSPKKIKIVVLCLPCTKLIVLTMFTCHLPKLSRMCLQLAWTNIS